MRIRLGIRGKLFLISFAIVLVMAIVSGVYLQFHLRDWMEARVASDLHGRASAVARLIDSAPDPDVTLTPEYFERIALALGPPDTGRITIISRDGTVLGDTEVLQDEVPGMENHSSRPEFLDALESGYGWSKRYSTTLKAWMLYVAVPYETGSHSGVVRVAMHLSEIDAIIRRLAGIIAFGIIFGLAVAAIMSMFASHLMSGTLRNLVDYSKQITQGKKMSIPGVSAKDELGGLAGSFNTLAGELEKVVGELSSERNYLEGILEAMDDAVLAIDGNQVVRLANSQTVKILGIDYLPVGRTLLEVIQVPVLHKAVMDSENDRPSTIEFDLPGAKPGRMLAHVTCLKSGAGKVIVMSDVTEIRKLETARRDFFANASHELRTPVGIIQANAETLAGGAIKDPAKAVEFLDAITRNSKRLSSLIADLLLISRIEEGRYNIDIGPVDILEQARAATSTLKRLAEEKGITVSVDIREGLKVIADSRGLEDVLFNLLDNAVKYAQEGGKVIIGCREKGDRIFIEVEDNGPGVPPDEKDRIFERFYRVDRGRSREMGGTGLGLSIVKHLVSAMGGDVRMEIVKPHGLRFLVSFKKA